jgi:hypothetical protein
VEILNIHVNFNYVALSFHIFILNNGSGGYSKQTDNNTLNYEEMTADHYSQEVGQTSSLTILKGLWLSRVMSKFDFLDPRW